jgi:hypothetical protein
MSIQHFFPHFAAKGRRHQQGMPSGAYVALNNLG